MNLNFKKEFADKVLKGKDCTIRAGKRWRKGMTAHCQTGPRFKPERILVAEVLEVANIKIEVFATYPDGVTASHYATVMVNNTLLSQWEIDQLALVDGFEDTQSFIDFFLNGTFLFEGQWIMFGKRSLELYKYILL
jgi:hypothetical protein